MSEFERNSMNIYFADQSFNQTTCNPYNNNLPYTDDWIMLQLLETADFKLFTGRGKEGIFRLIITKETPDWAYRVCDFIEYESTHGKNMILAIHKNDYEAAQSIYDNHSYADRFLRPYEQKVLVHTTTKENHVSIMQDGCLKSWNALKKSGVNAEEAPIGRLLGDPPDYSDYIMFSDGGVFLEIVVASKQKGKIEMDIDSPYISGARFYFDAERIAENGLLIRDGGHLKVKDCLPIDQYILWIATPDALGISENTTPRIFAEKADSVFAEKFGIAL